LTRPQRPANGYGGFEPTLSDEEVITIELCGEFFKLGGDQEIFDHFREHYPDWFPGLGERTRFVRQVANPWQVKAALQQRLTVVSGQADDPCNSLTRCRSRSVAIPAADATVASNRMPVMATVSLGG
jgi:hypothetical protein